MSSHPIQSPVPQQPPPVIGTPGQDIRFWEGQQGLPDDCAVKCQQFILEQFTGHHIDELTLVEEATAHGWYTPGGGTPSLCVGNLLESHGVGVHKYQHGNQFQLANELAQGHKVIVGVNGAKLCGEDPALSALKDALGMTGADHAVVVSGIDTSDPQHIRVIVSDPGTGNAIANLPLEQFLDAWHGSDFFMVATNDPAPAHLPEMAHFDYGLGHIHDVAGLSYDQFLAYEHHLTAWEGFVHYYVEVHIYHHDFPPMNYDMGHPPADHGSDFATDPGHLDHPSFDHSLDTHDSAAGVPDPLDPADDFSGTDHHQDLT